jgi:hypothetical protein
MNQGPPWKIWLTVSGCAVSQVVVREDIPFPTLPMLPFA